MDKTLTAIILFLKIFFVISLITIMAEATGIIAFICAIFIFIVSIMIFWDLERLGR